MFNILHQKIGEQEPKIEGLRTEIGETKAEMIKWMFIVCIGQIGATLAIILIFLKR